MGTESIWINETVTSAKKLWVDSIMSSLHSLLFKECLYSRSTNYIRVLQSKKEIEKVYLRQLAASQPLCSLCVRNKKKKRERTWHLRIIGENRVGSRL